MTVLPNFFIVGAAKAGTTSLYYYLDQHPDVFMCSHKEPNFFSYEDIKTQNLYYKEIGIEELSDYESLFKRAAGKKAIGEASVSYLFYADTPGRIKEFAPNAKIIILLRNPIQRAFSHYLMDKRLGYISLKFEDIIYQQTKHPLLNLYYQQYIELGFYFEQVKRYVDTFGWNNVTIYQTTDLKNNLDGTLQDLSTFLRIDPLFSYNLSKEHNVFKEPKNRLISLLYASAQVRGLVRDLAPERFIHILKAKLFSLGNKPKLGREIYNHLAILYKGDIKKLEVLINRDLSHWYKEVQ